MRRNMRRNLDSTCEETSFGLSEWMRRGDAVGQAESCRVFHREILHVLASLVR